MPTEQDILDVARGELNLGVYEVPPGSNKTKYGKWFGADGVPWCSEFVVWVYYQVFGGPALIYNLHTYYSGDIKEAAQRVGALIPIGQALPGDIVIFDWGDGGITDHIGFVEFHTPGSTTVYTIEGNTENIVARRVRTQGPKCVMWFVRPAYSKIVIPKIVIEDEEDDMVEATIDKAAIIPSWTDSRTGQHCDLAMSNQAAMDTVVKLFFRRDNGDMPDNADDKWTKAHTYTIGPENTKRIDVLNDLGVEGGASIKVQVLSGGAVDIYRNNPRK